MENDKRVGTFIADGSILPREGDTEKSLLQEVDIRASLHCWIPLSRESIIIYPGMEGNMF